MNKRTHIKLDMDGVLVDLDGYFLNQFGETLHDMTQDERELHWDEKFTVDWFINAPPMPDAFDLLDYCRNNYANVSILTALPHRRRDQAWQSMEAKIAWVHKYIGHEIPVTFGPYSEDKKKHCAGKDFVLIDDMQRNIKQWKNEGGYGIHHVNTEQTIYELKYYEKIMSRTLFR